MIGFEQIVREFSPALVRVAASYEADRSLRDDLVQDILFAIHHALPQLRDETRLAPFVFRIAHNRAVAHVLAERARKRPIELEPTPPSSPEDSLLAVERSRRLLAAVRRLPLNYRQVTTLLLEDLSHAEIADALGLTVVNVGVRVNRAKARLRELLDER
jgi:RNA polymerase sigma factor (sigma-70 family)